jgi:hypothetical protein
MGAFQATHPVCSNEMIYVEDFHFEMDDLFIRDELKPYLQGVFADFALRSTQDAKFPGKSIDKVTFTEYTNLPGIVSDRFYTLCKRERADGRVQEEDFLRTMITVFGSSVEQKMNFCFQM